MWARILDRYYWQVVLEAVNESSVFQKVGNLLTTAAINFLTAQEL
jgi:hypothetical protein